MPVVDLQCPWVTYQNGVTWHVQSVGYVNPDISGGNLGIYVLTVNKAKFGIWGVPFDLLLPGSVDHFGTYPQFKIDMAGGGFDPAHEKGPFKIQCGDAWVDGMGLPLNRHVIYVVTFRKMIAG